MTIKGMGGWGFCKTLWKNGEVTNDGIVQLLVGQGRKWSGLPRCNQLQPRLPPRSSLPNVQCDILIESSVRCIRAFWLGFESRDLPLPPAPHHFSGSEP